MRRLPGTTRFAAVVATLACALIAAAASLRGDDLEWQLKLAERRDWWSLRAVADPPVPEVRDAAWSGRPIDRFVLAKLEASRLRPAPRAGRATLVRRLSFALTGLPPAPDDVTKFAADDSPDAYEKLVERYLASPHFGERFARHWMDVVRYGDTYGYEWDIAAKGAWRYRDYLIRAFNADVPFDQLVREHVAGDLLERPRVRVNEELGINESVIATMFYQLGEKRHGDATVFPGVPQEMLNNKIDAFSKAFAATTIACARCHDHKLDAVAQRDYFSLAGMFMSSRWVTNTADLPTRNAEVIAELRGIKGKIREALAARWVRESREIAEQLLAAQHSLDNDSADPAAAAWLALLGDPGASSEEHPLYAWARVSRSSGRDDAQRWQALAAFYAEQRRVRAARNAADYQVIADFTKGVPDGWDVDGVGLRDGPVAPGDFTVALDGPQVVGQVLPGGLYTNSLSPVLNGAVRSPLINRFGKRFVSAESAGGQLSMHRIVHDNGFLGEHLNYFRGAGLNWVRQSAAPERVDKYVYLDLVTKASNPNFPPRVNFPAPITEEQAADPRSWFGVTRVVVHDVEESPRDELARFTTLFDGETPADLRGVAQCYERWMSRAVEAFARGNASEDEARLVQWMLERGLLSNRHDHSDDNALRDLVLAYRSAERRLLPPETMNGMRDLDPGRDYRVELRGVYDDLGDPAPRAYPQSLGGTGEPFATKTSGRRELAETIAARDNPLTARVFVNRVWHWLFGAGIVATPDDFGRLGELPSHPELLDHLAHTFASPEGHHWSIKQLVREIVLSEAFRQGPAASEAAKRVDPSNRLLHHFPLRRLEAEAVRDAVLAVSGRLDPALYGPPVDPPRTQEDPQKRLVSGPLDGNGRRAIYIKVCIMEPPKFLATFNQPNPKIPTGKRDVTNVPAQALALLNDPFVAGQAEFWAKQLVTLKHPSPGDRMSEMFRRAFSREPSPRELTRWEQVVSDLAALHEVNGDAVMTSVPVWKDVAHALFNTKEFLYVQ